MGGTFNPPHNGHILAAEHVRQAVGLDRVLFIPTNLPPHKRLPDGSATTDQRCDMVRLMVAPYDWAVFSDFVNILLDLTKFICCLLLQLLNSAP